jgi:hypothetical protein
MMTRVPGLFAIALSLPSLMTACGSEDTTSPTAAGKGGQAGADGGSAAGAGTGGAGNSGGGAGLAGSAGSGGGAGTSSLPPAGTAETVRDEHGVAHIFAGDTKSAFYALGIATAEDRLFQMFQHRSYMRGTHAEHFSRAITASSSAADATFNAKLLAHDRKLRILGFAAHADATWAKLPKDVPELLQAFADGVNEHLSRIGASLPEGFVSAGVDAMAPWSPADSLLVWQRIGMLSGAPDYAGEIARLIDCNDGACTLPACDRPLDEASANVLPPSDGTWPPKSSQSSSPGGGAPLFQNEAWDVPLRFSHGFVVSGDKTSTGKPFLFADPKFNVTAPNPWYPFRLVTPEMDVRAATFAGAPGAVLMSSANVSQTVTGGGGDTADVFRIVPGAQPGTYSLDGVDKPYTLRQETIAVRHGSPVTLQVEHTVFGPIIDPLVPNAPAGERYALSYIEHISDSDHSLVAGIELLRAKTLAEYRDALRHWNVPTGNAMYAGVDADSGQGHIAYHTLLGIADRKPVVVQGLDLRGLHPADGSKSANAWAGKLDLDWNPHVVDPPVGYIHNGNSLPVGAWHHALVYSGIAGVGDTYRNLTLRYRLAEVLASGSATPAELHALHYDASSEVARLYRDALKKAAELTSLPPAGPGAPATKKDKVAKVLQALEAWHAAGARLVQSNAWTPLATAVQGVLIVQGRSAGNPVISCRFHEGQGGVSYMLKTLEADPTAFDSVVLDHLFTVAAKAWDQLQGSTPNLPPDVTLWQPSASTDYSSPYQQNFDCIVPGAGATCGLDSSLDVGVPIDLAYTETIADVKAMSYPVSFDFANPDATRAATFPGVNERPSSPFFDNLVPVWEQVGKGEDSLPLAPYSRALLEAKASSVTTVTYQ